MNLTMDQPLLVAPRPVRLGTVATRAHAHAARADAASSADKDAASPRSSPRTAFASLPSDALEEFLSILRPAIFPPLSPVSPRRTAPSLPAYPHERALRLLADIAPDDIDSVRSQQPSRTCPTPDSITDDDSTTHYSPVRCYKSNVLSSPISRTHTRNPFLRYASNRSPATISPAAIPLPQPTPDEMIDMS